MSDWRIDAMNRAHDVVDEIFVGEIQNKEVVTALLVVADAIAQVAARAPVPVAIPAEETKPVRLGRPRPMKCTDCGMGLKPTTTVAQAKHHGWEVWVGGARCKACSEKTQ